MKIIQEIIENKRMACKVWNITVQTFIIIQYHSKYNEYEVPRWNIHYVSEVKNYRVKYCELCFEAS